MRCVRLPGISTWRSAAWLAIVGCTGIVAQDPPGGGGATADGDAISDAVELNGPNQRLYHFSLSVNDPDPSRARGTPTNGTITSALNFPDAHAHYYHYNGTDPVDSDDWGVLGILNVGEGTASDWGDATRPCVRYDQTPPLRFGTGDISRGNETTRTFGGSFQPDHDSHQNGLDMDIRYLRIDGAEVPLDLASPDSIYYNVDASADLMSCFLSWPNVTAIFVDTVYAGIDPSGDSRLIHDTGHRNHFHVRIADPDGLAN